MRTKLFSFFFLSLMATTTLANGRYIHHELSVRIAPESQILKVNDLVTIPAEQVKPVMYFLLHENLSVTSGTDQVTIELSADAPTAAAFGVTEKKLNLPLLFSCKNYMIKLPEHHTGDLTLNLIYEGKIYHPVTDAAVEYARSFSQTPGIIDSLGVYLGGSSYWIPWFNDDLISYNMTASLPMPWDAVSQGTRTLHESTGGNTRKTRWESPKPTEEIYLIAARFTEYQHSTGAVTVMAFLRTPDESLANKYLETTSSVSRDVPAAPRSLSLFQICSG